MTLFNAYNDPGAFPLALFDGAICFPMVVTRDNKLIIALLVDYGVWSRMAVEWIRELAKANHRMDPNHKIKFWITGTLSVIAKGENELLGISVAEKAFDRFK